MERRAIAVEGVVQGVGFRPFVFGLATRHRLSGFVKNESGGVQIEVEGESPCLDSFLRELCNHRLPLAKITDLSWRRTPPRGDVQFIIETSQVGNQRSVFVGADVATCVDCLAELFDPTDRRYRYPFLNCTNCGPRLTIVRGAPYDREQTTMAGFPMCAACRAEYEAPANRRYHAQPTACADCGPRLEARDAAGRACDGEPLECFVSALHQGKIGALKGLGGYHLACDARNSLAVERLRQRKQRDEKPFALMARDIGAVRALCLVTAAEQSLLLSPQRPIVMLRRRPEASVATAVAPGNTSLGVMLPYTPLHHLLMRDLGDVSLVMTSGNRSDEPMAHEDADALARLTGIADIFLLHNRPIQVRCDDSVTRLVDRWELPLRRSRGYAPHPIVLPLTCRRPILAVGGQFKGTFAIGRDRHAFLSHHLGDLDHYEAYRAFESDVSLYERLFGVCPEILAHDLHPDYASTRYAQARAHPMNGRRAVQLLGVQHHHAHLASCMAENQLNEPVIGVTFDGTGYGTDGAIWGGEFLVGDYQQFRRAARLRYVLMPGAERAIREPWRMALAHLRDAGQTSELLGSRIAPSELRTVERMLDQRFNSPATSSVGRLFDAVAALAGVRDRVRYEGQAAVELEWLATEARPAGSYPFEVNMKSDADEALEIDTRPLISAVAADIRRRAPRQDIARRFHAAVVDLIAVVCARLRRGTGLNAIVLSGGVFTNALLTQEAAARLEADGFRVYRHRLVPPNDGGLSLGQLAIAAAQRAPVSGRNF
ncbi:MAG: carbamoyltransferase HypF [Gemmataceae bacterium]|nr:carbamoyltransferase HypF [Gemmataceae bacterium]